MTTAKEAEYIAIDVTDVVKGWITNSNNYGLLFKPNGTAIQVFFDAKENADASHAPLLEVTLKSNGSITGTGALTFTSGGTNTSITLTPNGTGRVVASSDLTVNGLTVGRGGGGSLFNFASGLNALAANTTGTRNVGIGWQSLYYNTIGEYNTGVGFGAATNNTTGSSNTAFGQYALGGNSTGNGNTALGSSSLYAATGNYNVAIGCGAGSSPNDPFQYYLAVSNSVFIGAGAKGFNDTDVNTIVIGYNAASEGANTTVLGNTDITKTHIFGSLTIGGGSTARELRILQASGGGTYYTGFKAPNLGGNIIYTLPTTDGSNGYVLTTNGTGGLSWTSPSVTNISGNAATATALQTAHTINTVSFNGTGDIVVTAAAGTLTGTTLNSGVVTSSLTSLGTVTGGAWNAAPIADAYIASAATWNAKQSALTFSTGLTNTSGTITIASGAITNSMLAGSIDLTSKVTGALPPGNGGTGQTSALASADALNAKGADIASASTTNLATATGVFVNVTGTATIDRLGTATAGIRRWVRFTNTGTITNAAPYLILPGGADIIRADGDCAIFESLGSNNWRCISYQRGNAAPIGLRIQPQGDVAMDFHAGPTP